MKSLGVREAFVEEEDGCVHLEANQTDDKA
jgi:hypothetical protein